MKHVIAAGLVFAVTLASGALFSGAAQAHLFLWTGATPSLVLVHNESRVVFTPVPGGGKIECASMSLDGAVTKASALAGRVTGLFLSCSAFGFAGEISPVEFEYNADETVAVVGKAIVISVPAAGCSVKVEPSAANGALSKLRYLKDVANANALLGHAEVTGITSFSTGGLCGTQGTSKEGAFTALGLASVDASGTLSWC